MGLGFLDGGDSTHWVDVVNPNTVVLNLSQLDQRFFRIQCAFDQFEPVPLTQVECGKVKNLTEIAALEGIDNSYVSRMVNRTTLVPDIVEAILKDALPNNVTLFDLVVDPPALWKDQR